MQAIESKNKDAIEKEVKNFEKDADPNYVSDEDKELLDRLKKHISNKDSNASMQL